MSILALGQINPTKYINAKEYLTRYGGMDLQVDKDIRIALSHGASGLVPIPEMPAEKPPGPLMVFADKKARKAIEFPLCLGAISKRFPAPRGGNLDIYLSGNGATSATVMEGKKRKIHSIPIAESCEEMLVFFIKPPTLNWKGYQVIPMDFSPKVVPARSVLLVNFSKRPLLVRPDLEGPAASNKPAQLLKPGTSMLYKIPEKLDTIRLLYANPATPDKILCSVNCDALPDQRAVAFTYGLGLPENGIDVTCRSLQFPIAPLKKEEAAQGIKEIPKDDPTATE